MVRSVFGYLISGTLVLASASPTYAFDGGSFGAGLAGGLIGGMLAGAARQQQPSYYYRERRVYVHPHYYAAPRGHVMRTVRAASPRHGRGGPDVSEETASTDQPWIIRTYWNCNNPASTHGVTAKAEHGYVKDEVTSRMICGHENYPAKQFVYMSPSGYTGTDRVDFFENGRLVATNILTVKEGGKQWQFDGAVNAASGEEAFVTGLSGCGQPAISVRATSGFASVRHEHASGSECNGNGKQITKVFYKSPGGFSGPDKLIMYSSAHAPVEFLVNVEGEEPRMAEASPAPKDSSDARALAELAATVDKPALALERPDAPTAMIQPAAIAPTTDASGDVRGQCRMDNCNFFKVQTSDKVGSTGNGQLYKANMLTWGASYPDGEYDKPAKKIGDKAVEQTYFFCSKSRPTAFYRNDNQWFQRDLRPGDKGDVTNANYDRYVEYYAVCHHTVVDDPYNVASLSNWGYSFPTQAGGEVVADKKVNDPTDILK